MTRMIERWFPSQEVSENSTAGWGSGNTERNLFTWFAARPTAQAKAAVICSLLPWPDDEGEQKRLQDLVRRAMTGRYAAHEELRQEILAANPDGASMLDPFSGRGMIPLEAARLGLESHAIEYSPVAVIASHLLTDYPFRDWRAEPELPFGPRQRADLNTYDEESAAERYLRDVKAVLEEVGKRHSGSMAEFYPEVDGKQPWGYLWAVTLPCQECGRRFPLVGSYNLRMPAKKKANKSRPALDDPGQSFYIDVDPSRGTFQAVVHDGLPRKTPTLTAGSPGARGKAAICPFCSHVHTLETHKRLASEGHCKDALLVASDHDPQLGKVFRSPTEEEFAAADRAAVALRLEPPFTPVLPAVPNELIPEKSGATIRPQLYGARIYGDLMIDRQTLSFVQLARVILSVERDLEDAGVGTDYRRALTGMAAAQLVRQLKFSTRGAQTDPQSRNGSNRVYVNHIFANESTIAFSHDNFEAGIGTGPGTWDSMVRGAQGGLSTLASLLTGPSGNPTQVKRGTATSLPYPDQSIQAVVTDPPYDAMVYYSDSSDLMYAWLKRALLASWPEIVITPDDRGLQDKSEEIIVMDHNKTPDEHRTREHYDHLITQAFTEMRRVVRQDGVVTIVFGHGDPDVWRRLLGALQNAGLVMTGSWPANTEAGGQQGKANIKTTLTMACRPAATNRPAGLRAQVEVEVREEVKSRMSLWESSGLAPTDMLMASAGPAMEIVGRYSAVVDHKGDEVDPYEFLIVARRAVQEAFRIEIDHHPLDTFDLRTRFALWWLQLFGKGETGKDELRWQTLVADLDVAAVRDLMTETSKGVRFTDAKRYAKGRGSSPISEESSVIDAALAMAAAWEDGLTGVGEVLAQSGRGDDPFLWAVLGFLADRLVESDADAIACNRILRNRTATQQVAKGVTSAVEAEQAADRQTMLQFDDE